MVEHGMPELNVALRAAAVDLVAREAESYGRAHVAGKALKAIAMIRATAINAATGIAVSADAEAEAASEHRHV